MAVVGVPTEIKTDENRVAITPAGVHELVLGGHTVLVEAGAGEGSAFGDDDYRTAGATIVATAAEAWAADIVCKVKEPQAGELDLLRPDLVLFTYLHLAAYPAVAAALERSGCTAIAYETVQDEQGRLPLLAPMSEIAGRVAPQVGAYFLERSNGGRGLLLGGAPGVERGKVVVIGAGMAGQNAALIARGLEADVTIFDTNLDKLRFIDSIHRGAIKTRMSNLFDVATEVIGADLVIGAVLVPGARAPKVVTREHVSRMKKGAVLVDISIDQGGCFETSHETKHSDPVYTVDGVLHYAVGNIPGAVPRTSTIALTNVTLPFVRLLADRGVDGAVGQRPELASGINIRDGVVVHPAVKAALAGSS
jgi:alanine dehydrogenase